MYTRAKFGIEYTPDKPRDEHPGFGWIVFVVVLAALTLITRAIWKRATAPVSAPTVNLATDIPSAPATPAAVTNLQVHTSTEEIEGTHRPIKVQNLLRRLQEAEKIHDIEMAISTIEQLRETSGAEDLDDKLARKLGALNIVRLFELKSAQWTTRVKVKRGDSASRIAYEHGSTHASLIKLNTPSDKPTALNLKPGQTLTVMNHPRFRLVITRRTRTADLSLNGKFFKRYYLTDDVSGTDGSYEITERFRTFCTTHGVPFRPLDRAELEMLLPKNVPAFIKDI